MSTRKEIRNAIVTSLRQISQQAGYNNDIALVTKRNKAIEDITAWPTLCVLSGQDTAALEGNNDLYHCFFALGVVGYGRVPTDTTDEGLIADAADDLMEDIENKLISDHSLVFGEAASMKNLSIVSEDPLFDYESNQFSVQVNIIAEFYHSSGQT